MQNLTLIEKKKQIKDKALKLVEALQFLRDFTGETFVIQYSGVAMTDPDIADAFASDVIAMKQLGLNIIIVHDGANKVSSILEKFSLKSSDTDGENNFNTPSIEMVEMVMSGLINKQIVSTINKMGGSAVGISGKDGNLIVAKRLRKLNRKAKSNIEKILDLGYMGSISTVNPEILLGFEETEHIPVISPIAIGEHGETFQVNADEAASVIASSLGACKLIMMSDHAGINYEGKLKSKLSLGNLEKILKSKIIDSELLSKINACINSLKLQTESTHIVDGRVPHSLLLEIFTKERLGTMICL